MPRIKTALNARLLALATTILTASLGCGGSDETASGPQGRGGSGPGDQSIPVAVEPVVLGTAASYYTSTATLEAESHAEILARTTGVVRSLVREEGDTVRAGDALLLLEDDEARLRVRQAEANLKTTQGEHERRRRMLEGGLLSAEEFETIENTLQIRESEFELAKLDLSYTRVSAPFPGKLVRRLVDLGANVSPGTPLFEVMDVKPLLARVYVPAKRMGFLAVGQEMEITLDSDGSVLTGIVSLISPIVDPSTGTVKVTAEILEYPQGTRPGDFAQVRIVTARNDKTKLVPSRAIFEEQGQDILYVIEDGKAVRRTVETGFVDGEATEILTGAEVDELVAVKGQRQLREGIEVEILEGPPEVLAAAKAAAEDKTEPESSDEDETSSDAS